jgi:hypothetical protein
MERLSSLDREFLELSHEDKVKVFELFDKSRTE